MPILRKVASDLLITHSTVTVRLTIDIQPFTMSKLHLSRTVTAPEITDGNGVCREICIIQICNESWDRPELQVHGL